MWKFWTKKLKLCYLTTDLTKGLLVEKNLKSIKGPTETDTARRQETCACLFESFGIKILISYQKIIS